MQLIWLKDAFPGFLNISLSFAFPTVLQVGRIYATLIKNIVFGQVIGSTLNILDTLQGFMVAWRLQMVREVAMVA